MITTDTYRYSLDKSSRKFRCPSCGQKTFVRYVDKSTGQHLADHVGRCDRENNCTHHFTPKEHFRETGTEISDVWKAQEVSQPQAPSIPVDFVPADLLSKSMTGFDQSSFALFVADLFGPEHARELLLRYMVGRSRQDQGKACIYWRIDTEGRIRSGKIMQYDRKTGKRNKETPPSWVHSQLKPDFNFQNCFFGEHLLTEFPGRTVAIVESEKTAILCSFFMPQYNWLATGGKTGLKWREIAAIKPLDGHDVILFPDFGKPDKSGKTPFTKWQEMADYITGRLTECRVKVSPILENNLENEMRAIDLDLADLLIRRDTDTQSGIALTEGEYPAIWDRLIKYPEKPG
ncbi:MAG: hypothetical protein HZA79_05020 [Sphingobacteriales bacterium]|nr:hypothetical protein [Sphingobacteriales bacterium]